MTKQDKLEFVELALRQVDERAITYSVLRHGLCAFVTVRRCQQNC